jgi:adenylate cyclase
MNRRRQIVVWVTVLGTALGVAYALIAGEGNLRSVARGIVAGLPISLAISLFEAYLVDGPRGLWLRRLPFAAAAALRIAVWLAIIVAGLAFMRAVLPIPGEGPADGFAGDTIYGLFLVTVAVAYLSVDRMLGRGNLWRLLRGRYHRPRIEERIFLFLDMEGSTAAAERIGAAPFLALLAEAVRHATPAVVESGGEIYRYVGDEIVATWQGGRADAALAGAVGAIRALDDAAPGFVARFGVPVRLRGGLNGGPVAVGEIGDARREIVYLGDPVNVAKRLETACRDLGERLVVSAAVAAHVADPDLRARLRPLGPVRLPGRAASVEILAARV